MSADDNRMNAIIETEALLKARKYDRVLKKIGFLLCAFVYEKSHLQRFESVLNKCYSAIFKENTSETPKDQDDELRVELAMDFGELAESYQDIKEWQNSIETWQKTLEFKNMSESKLREIGRMHINDYLNNTYYNLGFCFEEVGELEKALDSSKKAIEFKPTDKDALFNLGMFSGRMKRYSESIDAFERYLNIDSESERALEVKQALQQDRKDFELEKMASQLETNFDSLKPTDIFEYSFNLIRNGKSQVVIKPLKRCLFHDNLSLTDRIIVHYNLATALTRGWAPIPRLKENLTQHEINEIAANLDMAAHLYDYFLEDSAAKARLKSVRDQAKMRLTVFITSFGSSVEYDKGKWSTASTYCAIFRNFSGYPNEYCEIKKKK